MKRLLVVASARDPARQFTDELVAAASRHHLELVALRREGCEGLAVWDGEPVEIVLAVGGDGTVLEAVRHAVQIDRPVLGFNLGTIGFLTEAEPEELTQVLEALERDAYSVETRMMLGASLDGGEAAVGVNDVVIEKIDSQRLVVLDVEIDNARFLTYRADGVVIATSTGSTAYAFSAGGPLVDPALEAILVTPVAPHSLFDRTLVLPPETRIGIRVAANRSVRVSVDGVEYGSLDLGDSVVVERGEQPARFVRLRHQAFPAQVVEKFKLS